MFRKNLFQVAAIAVALLGLCGCSVPQNADSVQERDPSKPVEIRIAPGKSLGPVNTLIFGNNMEAANGKNIFSSKVDTRNPTDGQGSWDSDLRAPVPEVVAICKDVNLSMLRYPGGCLTHNFDWHQAVGDVKDRTYFRFGIDEYIELCRTIEAVPLMNVSEICSPKDAADLVEYLNSPATPAHPWAMKRAKWGHPEPYHVKYFEMANESDHGNHNVKPQLKRSAAEYAEWYLSCAAAMRKKDSKILIGGHAGTGTPVSDPWNATVLKLAGKEMDFFAVHTYAVRSSSQNPDLPMRACMASVEQMAGLLADYRALIKELVGKDIPLAITEFNAGFVQQKPIPYRFTFGSALFCADYIRVLLQPENNVAFANYWQFLNGYWGYARTKTKDGKTRVETRAAYPIFKLLGSHLGTSLLECKVSNEPKLEFEGFGRALPAKKDFQTKKKFIRKVEFPIADNKSVAYKIKTTGKDSIEVVFKDFSGETYFDFKDFEVQPSHTYQVSFALKVTPQSGSISPGLGLCDKRGWSATMSACGVQGSDKNVEWTHFQAEMNSLHDADGLRLVLRIRYADDFTGKVELRNISIDEYKPKSFPAYSALTAFAMGTPDQDTVKLIVVNKHHTDDLPAHVSMQNIRNAKIWTVSAPDLAVISHSPDGAFERVSGEAIDGISPEGFTRTFPARSISAIEITLEPEK